MNLVRNHIIYWYRWLADKVDRDVQLSLFEGVMDMSGERPVPPVVPVNYMVPGGKYPDRHYMRQGGNDGTSETM